MWNDQSPSFQPISIAHFRVLGFTHESGFHDLPTEIVLELWHRGLLPDDIASFALVLKRIFALAQAISEGAPPFEIEILRP